MALSGTITSSLTANQIVTTALELLGNIEPGDAAPAHLAALGLKHLNWQLKTWQTQGVCDGWRTEDLELSILAATKATTLVTNYLDLTNVRYRDSDDIDTDLTQYSLQEYAALPDKDTVGEPTAYAIRKTRTSLILYLWPVSASAITIVSDASRVMQDVTDLAQDVDLPQEWTECCFYALAARMAIPCGLTVSDPARYGEIKARAADLFATLKSFDEETGSVFFGVDA